MKTKPTTVTFSGEDYTKLQEEINTLKTFETAYLELRNHTQHIFTLLAENGVNIKVNDNPSEVIVQQSDIPDPVTGVSQTFITLK